MTTWLMNSAVIPEGCYGSYAYESATVDELKRIIRHAESRIGYDATADQIERWTGYRPEIRRDSCALAVGDVAYVVRLRYRIQDPREKHFQRPAEDQFEIGKLTRTA
jgi:hypothetical protein